MNFWDRTEELRVVGGMILIPLSVLGTIALAIWKVVEFF